MRYAGTLHRRVVHLERVQQPTTQSKLDDVQSAAIAATSLEDLKLLEQLKLLEVAGKDSEATVDQRMAVDRFNEVFTDALLAISDPINDFSLNSQPSFRVLSGYEAGSPLRDANDFIESLVFRGS